MTMGRKDLFGDIEANRASAEKRGINFDVEKIQISLLKDVEVEGDALEGNEIISIEGNKRVKYSQHATELDREFNQFLWGMLNGYERKLTLESLHNYVLEIMEKLFGLNEFEAVKVILYHKNRPKFEEIIRDALADNLIEVRIRRQQAKTRAFKEVPWAVPETRDYNTSTHRTVPEAQAHALQPFYRMNQASQPEIRFEQFLEDNREYIDWWYKNGDDGMQHYAIAYMEGDNPALFYPDFVLRMANGQVFIFDTKTNGSDPYAAAKHNALVAYMEDPNNPNLMGGILIQDGNLWRYSLGTIENTDDITGWMAFHPSDYKKS